MKRAAIILLGALTIGCTESGNPDWKLITNAALTGAISALNADEHERKTGIVDAIGVIQEGLE